MLSITFVTATEQYLVSWGLKRIATTSPAAGKERSCVRAQRSDLGCATISTAITTAGEAWLTRVRHID